MLTLVGVFDDLLNYAIVQGPWWYLQQNIQFVNVKYTSNIFALFTSVWSRE